MLLYPPIIALFVTSMVVVLVLLFATLFAIQITRRWDLSSASEGQILLEKKTYLISMLLVLAFILEILSLLLFVFTTDRMAPLFTGAMCTVGVLNVNSFGFPTLFFKMLAFVLASIWLLLNYLDHQAFDYPLLRFKYLLLLFILPVAIAETALQTVFFLQLTPNVITSCCGSLFSAKGGTISSELASLSPLPLMIVLYLFLGCTIAVGVLFLIKRKGGYLFSILSAGLFPLMIVSIVSFLSLYLYEQPHHHCPFCILKAEYHYQGYLLYLPLFIATSFGIAVAALLPFSRRPSLVNSLPSFVRKLAFWSTALYTFELFYLSKIILLSHLHLIES